MSSVSGSTRPSEAGGPKLARRPDKRDELRLLVNSRNPIITAPTPEEECVERLLIEIATELDVPLYTSFFRGQSPVFREELHRG